MTAVGVLSSLCAACNSISLKALERGHDEVPLREYQDVAALDQAAQTGCKFCAQIAASHTQQHRAGDAKARSSSFPLPILDWHSPITVFQCAEDVGPDRNVVWRCLSTGPRRSCSFNGRLGGFFADEGDPAANEVSGRRIDDGPIGERHFAQAQQWLQDCISSHVTCSSSVAAVLPTRVLELGHGVAFHPQVRLIAPPVGSKADYVALSYCWGKDGQATLTTSNIGQRLSQIEASELSQTVQDAITVTLRLGLKYLWVDALCILQDSTLDCEENAARMCDVYNSACVTIQASKARRAKDGFLTMRDVSPIAPSRLTYRCRDGTIGSVYLRQLPLVTPVIVEPAHRRGWILQESLLSPRLLSFGSSQMEWECNHRYCSEGGSTLVNSDFFVGLPKPIRRKYKGTDRRPASLELNNSHLQTRLTWAYIIAEYTARDLTYSKDKLPALGGLASLIARTRSDNDRYLAGLWRNDMPQNLLWGPLSTVRRPKTYRAPSWSWACLDGAVDPFGADFASTAVFCEVLDAHMTLTSSDNYGGVQDGRLVVRGPLKKGWRILDQRTLDGDAHVQFFYAEAQDALSTDRSIQLKLGFCGQDVLDEPQEINTPLSTWFLRIGTTSGLGLRARPDGAFERVGEFSLDGDKVAWFEHAIPRTIEIL